MKGSVQLQQNAAATHYCHVISCIINSPLLLLDLCTSHHVRLRLTRDGCKWALLRNSLLTRLLPPVDHIMCDHVEAIRVVVVLLC